MKLAMALGYANVDDMLASITSRQLREWMEFYRLEPFGEERADLRAGIIASTIANVNRSSRTAKAFSPKDFMPDFDRGRGPRKRQRLEDMKAAALALCLAFGGSVTQKK
jgi:hypothetical protein